MTPGLLPRNYMYMYVHVNSGGNLVPSLGGRNIFSRTKISEWRVFRKKFPFSRRKFLMTFFRIFRIFYQIFRIFYYVQCRTHVYDPFLTRTTTISEKNSFMTPVLLCSYFRAHPTTLLLKILVGRMHGAPPHQIFFWGDRPPVPYRSPPLHVKHVNFYFRLIASTSAACIHS